MPDNEVLLEVEDLKTHFDTRHGIVKAVDGVSFTLQRGEKLGIVGESGSGKSVTAFSLMRALPGLTGKTVAGRVLFDGIDLLTLPQEQMRRIRGGRISMICQNPNTSLNPLFTVGEQLRETVRFHTTGKVDSAELNERMLQSLREVQLPAPDVLAGRYPFQMSGGMKQRVAIAMALICGPDILVADEPTTALDVTIQAQILRLLREVQERHGTSIIFITHDLGVVAQLCDTVAVMYAGRVVEYNDIHSLFRQPRHPYTAALLKSNPVFGSRQSVLHAMQGQPPDLVALPKGCAFVARCPQAHARCRDEPPPKVAIDKKHFFVCWLKDGAGGAHAA
jgi:oligopeptide/dipeptide ABC transporter ATP-binding protein